MTRKWWKLQKIHHKNWKIKTKLKILIKILAISKIVHLALVKDVPSSSIAQLEKNTKAIYLEKRNS